MMDSSEHAAKPETEPIGTEASPLSLRIIPETTRSNRGIYTRYLSLLQLSARESDRDTGNGVDVVVVLDRSASMATESKMRYALATVEYLVTRLREQDRIHIIAFNTEVTSVTENLVAVTDRNRTHLLNGIRNIRPSGSTDISAALGSALTVVNEECKREDRVCTIMFFTDGVATCGKRGKSLTSDIVNSTVPSNCTVFAFGYGSDHCSDTLKMIAGISRGGVYYFIESAENIGSTFSECINGVLTTQALDVRMRLSACGGCGINRIETPYHVERHSDFKEFTVNLGSLFEGEQRNVLVHLGVKSVFEDRTGRAPISIADDVQDVLRVEVSFVRPGESARERFDSLLRIERDGSDEPWTAPVEIEMQKQRLLCCAAIQESVEHLEEKRDRTVAAEPLTRAIESIKGSPCYSQDEEGSRPFCEDIIRDLQDCVTVVMQARDVHYLRCIHQMHAYERATGSNYFKHISKDDYESFQPKVVTTCLARSSGYGYTSFHNKNRVYESMTSIESASSHYQ
jgi:Mg-chelatase subunit ChlD